MRSRFSHPQYIHPTSLEDRWGASSASDLWCGLDTEMDKPRLEEGSRSQKTQLMQKRKLHQKAFCSSCIAYEILPLVHFHHPAFVGRLLILLPHRHR